MQSDPNSFDGSGYVERQAESVERSSRHVEAATGAVKESADRRTELAANRTVLAAERTYAAWVRTGLAALASGVGARALLADILPSWVGLVTGSVLIAFSGFCFGAAVWRELSPGASPPQPDTPRIPRKLLMAVNGFLVLVSCAALLGIWLVRG
jgi:putative membrane protein